MIISTLFSLVLAADVEVEGLAMKPLDCAPAALCATNLGSPGRRIESWLESALLRHTRGRLKVVTPAKFIDLLQQSGYTDRQVREQCQNDECVAQLIGALSIEYLLSAELVALGDEGFELTLRLWGSEQSLATESIEADSIGALKPKLRALVGLTTNAVLEPSPPTATAFSTRGVGAIVQDILKPDAPSKKPTQATLVAAFRLQPGIILRGDVKVVGPLWVGLGVAQEFDSSTVLEGYTELRIFGDGITGPFGGFGAVARSWRWQGDNGTTVGYEFGGGALLGYRRHLTSQLIVEGSTLLGALFTANSSNPLATGFRFDGIGAAFHVGFGRAF
ncbi:MAG TPA: hypothetical protein DEB46_07910 [Myxococcales bacterium]|nr:hypothetical protein [Myxococcales bacterium]